MHRALITAWPLFFGLAMIMVGNGLQGTLLGVRADMEGFSTFFIGIIMSLYYVGFLLGSYHIPHFITTVGHIRVFAALASLASTTVLFHGLFSDPWLWALVRIFTGFSFAGLYIVVESWINNMATNAIRGKLLSIYLFITYFGLAVGQFLLNLSSPGEIQLFILTSVLVSLAVLPISLSSRPAPEFVEPEHISLRRLYIMSPLGLTGSFLSGIAGSTMFGVGAVYAVGLDMSFAQISTFLAIYILGGVFFQLPIGWLSDQIDRRKVIIAVSFLTSILAYACHLFSAQIGILFYIATFVFGGLSLTIYGLCLAHTNDHLTQRQIISAGSSLILVNAVGACFGPIVVATLMDVISLHSFFPFLTIMYSLIYLFGIYRANVRDSVPLEEQGDYVAMPLRSSPIILQIAEEDTPSNQTQSAS